MACCVVIIVILELSVLQMHIGLDPKLIEDLLKDIVPLLEGN